MRRKGYASIAGVSAIVVAVIALPPVVRTQQQPESSGLVPFTRDLSKELANKMKGTYTVAAVGDLDMYVGHGNHTMQGIEIYKGRPIFYNLGNFAVMRWGASDSAPTGDGMTAIERAEGDGAGTFQQYINLVAMLARTTYKDGILQEVRIYPVDLGVDRAERTWSKMSVAQTPSPALANRILSEIQKYSEPFGTKIVIENGVGVIRVPPEATVPIGGDIRGTFRGAPAGAGAGGRGRGGRGE